MSDHDTVEAFEEQRMSRRGVLVKGGVLAAGATFLGSQAAEAFGAATVTKTKIAVVTHGDTGSFWSVFKKGVDQAGSDLKARGVSVSQVYANNDVSKQVAGLNQAIAGQGERDRDLRPRCQRVEGSLTRAASRGIEIITVNSGLGAFDNLRTYMVHVGQTEDVAGQGAGKVFNGAGAKNLVVVIHEASNSGLTQRAAGAKKTFTGTTKVLVIPQRHLRTCPGRSRRSPPTSRRIRRRTRSSVSTRTSRWPRSTRCPRARRSGRSTSVRGDLGRPVRTRSCSRSTSSSTCRATCPSSSRTCS